MLKFKLKLVVSSPKLILLKYFSCNTLVYHFPAYLFIRGSHQDILSGKPKNELTNKKP